MHRKALIAIAVGSTLGAALSQAYAADQQSTGTPSQINPQQAAHPAEEADVQVVTPPAGAAQSGRSQVDRNADRADVAKDQRDIALDKAAINADARAPARDPPAPH